ncbi:cilia- and flagella-associated protein 161 [Drosophila ficusphila]|uniref:cilia- and flagella-associated protein 161 n=1 Tax=Drosophila ficusphila TaxID=30025 RepID=UPI0007E72D22|nr:cilia- and flagella-associated protein 161 [Drosophila ficusphila]
MYSPGVRVGNWMEAALTEEMRVKEMKQLRESGNLLLDRTRALYERFYQETVLGPPQDVLAFGVVVQLRPVRINVCREQVVDQNLVLSVMINQEWLHRNCTAINEMCDLTVAPSQHPSLRNSFRIVSPDEKDRSGQYLAYGEKFRLQTLEPADEPMFVYSGPKRLNLSLPVDKHYFTTKNGEVTLPLALISHKNCGPAAMVPTSHTHFFCAHEDPALRFESEGKTIPVNKPLIIVHAVTNRNLAVENVVANTLFGPEFQVSVQTYKNVYKRETWKNHWKFTY